MSKYIGINQRVPFSVIDNALSYYLESGELDREEILNEMLAVTKGANRAEKASKYAVQILTRPEPLLKGLQKGFSSGKYARLSENERKVIVLCLVCYTFPIVYDALCSIATVLKVQPQVSRAYINQKMGVIYGSNRTLDIALDAIIPMMIELNTIKREKTGIYVKGNSLNIKNHIIAELYIYSDIFLSGSKSINRDDVSYRAWFFFNQVDFKPEVHNKLLKFTEGRIGGGYIGL